MPEKSESDKSKTPEISRREKLKKKLKLGDAEELDMPPCDAHYLVGYLFEMGPTLPSGLGDSALTHGEIAAWQSNTGIELNAWESRTLKRLSNDYMSEARQANKIDRPAPWQDIPDVTPSPDHVAASLKASMRELAKL